jgi:hypothetical protein
MTKEVMPQHPVKMLCGESRTGKYSLKPLITALLCSQHMQKVTKITLSQFGIMHINR